ncbi:pyruvate dehydrogenase [Lysinibacter cavernae]|uniref:Pyruvate dehydrogenase E1 component n=1 Tax=Lysinibacter cavernae TaxID=1640652 RepID=A0A7X5R4H1_9MICO|nr:pyruvate dehydrogenase [Lysinibacter cavernae]NIH55160.1 pyruvate dehydrogenase E1 component [Lysinibacter cavernae]
MTDIQVRPVTEATIEAIARRVLWLSTAMIDHANKHRPNPGGVKVGGHQASSASIVSIMTELWLEQLSADDRVSVKPHASPVLHALNYLLGSLDREALTTLRSFGGLQSYPSRSKDPDPVDYSTGSVGIGATAPIWGAIARRYVADHGSSPGTGRQYSLVGDAELDEGAVWEAIGERTVSELGEVVWIIDFNRQSLDRVVPDTNTSRLQAMFAAAGWQVIEAKYGRTLTSLFERKGGESLRNRIDTMPNAEYQRLLRSPAEEVVDRLLAGGQASNRDDLAAFLDRTLTELTAAELLAALRDLGGHDINTLRDSFATIDDHRPTALFAYTLKGWGLASEGHPQNHSALISETQLAELRERCNIGDDPFPSFRDADPTAPRLAGPDEDGCAAACAAAARRLRRHEAVASPGFAPPLDLGWSPTGIATTQAALGRTLMDLSRRAPEIASSIVTVSPDVSSSTNLGGWVNKVGVWSPSARHDWFSDDPETILHWREHSAGQHLELGIAEVNLVGALGELGATWSRWGHPLIPIGVLYDPFIARALEPWTFGVYAGGQSILVGTPSGVTLSAEGGAHQSIITPSIGLEQPGVLSYEPAFAIDLEWMLLECIRRIGSPSGTASYLRLSTRPIDQALAALPSDSDQRELRRRLVIAGAYPLRRAVARAERHVNIAVVGAVTPEALEAAERLDALGISCDVLCITNPGLVFDAVQARGGVQPDAASSTGNTAEGEWMLRTVFGVDDQSPLVTVLDGHPHTLAFLSGIHRTRGVHLGVRSFGQSGDLESVYAHHGIDASAITRAALSLT